MKQVVFDLERCKIFHVDQRRVLEDIPRILSSNIDMSIEVQHGPYPITRDDLRI
jgi:hypothetical protein